MSRTLRYLPEVARDYVEAFGYREVVPPSAALKFDAEFSRAETEVESGMVTHQRVFQHYNRILVARFPYDLTQRN